MAEIKFTIKNVAINELLSGIRSGEGLISEFAASKEGRKIIRETMIKEYPQSEKMKKYPLEKILEELDKLEKSYFHIYLHNMEASLYRATIKNMNPKSGTVDFDVDVDWRSESFAYVNCCESAWE